MIPRFFLAHKYYIRRMIEQILANSIAKEFVFYSASTIILSVSRFVINLITAKSLGPDIWGKWNLLNLILAYSSLIHLGVLNGMNRDIPISRGRGDIESVKIIRSVTIGFLFTTTGIVTLILFVIGLIWYDNNLRYPLCWLSFLLLITQLFIFIQTYLASDKQFNIISRQQFILALTLLCSTIPLTILYGLSGFIVGQLLSTLIAIISVIRSGKIEFVIKINNKELTRLIRVGFPIMMVGLLYTLLTTVDRWIISAYLGTEQLGYYSLSLMVFAIISLLPMVVSQQMYPRMAETWGRTGRVSDVMHWVSMQAILGTCITAPIIIIAYLLFPPFIRNFMQEFKPGLPTIYPILLGPFFLSLASGFANMLNTLDKQSYYLCVQAFALFLAIGLDIFFIKAGWGILGVAWGTALTFIFYALLLTLIGLGVANSYNQSYGYHVKE